MAKRRHFKQIETLQDRLAAFAADASAEAAKLPPGAQRDDLLSKVRQAETASYFDEWASSPEKPPT
jgi:hypothetical protein